MLHVCVTARGAYIFDTYGQIEHSINLSPIEGSVYFCPKELSYSEKHSWVPYNVPDITFPVKHCAVCNKELGTLYKTLKTV